MKKSSDQFAWKLYLVYIQQSCLWVPTFGNGGTEPDQKLFMGTGIPQKISVMIFVSQKATY